MKNTGAGWRTRVRLLGAVLFVLFIAGAGGATAIAFTDSPGTGFSAAAMQIDSDGAAGLALVAFGFGLMLAETFVPGFGMLGLTGLLCFGLGASFLYQAAPPEDRFGWTSLFALGGGGAALMIWAVVAAIRAYRRRVSTGLEDMLGARARVLDWRDRSGHVRVAGERWQAQGGQGLAPGAEVAVTSVDGLILTVGPPSPGTA